MSSSTRRDVTRPNARDGPDGREAEKKEAGRSPLRPAQSFTSNYTDTIGVQTVSRDRHFGHAEVAECAGCGAVTELLQDSACCWTCTYNPPCLCAGSAWRTGHSEE